MNTKNIAIMAGVVIVCLIVIHAASAKGYRDSYAAVATNNSSWSDYTYNLKVKPITTGSWQNALVQFRVTDWWDNGTSNMPIGYAIYMWGPHHAGTGEDVPGSFQLKRIDGSSPSQHISLFNSAPGIITDGPMDFSIALSGARITISINNNIEADIVDTAPLLYGGIGVGAIWESEASFDNVLVTGSSGTLFSDDFDSGVPKNDWDSINGTQWVQDGWLHSKVVPEPATLFLLTLGGLFLRKRKI